MSCNLTTDMVIDYAVKIEQAGRKFYSNLAIREYNADIKDLLVYLAGEEIKHADTFEAMRTALKENEPNCGDEPKEVLEAIMNAHLFIQTDVEDAEYKIDDSFKTLLWAIQFERDSIMVFQEMKEVVGDSGKELLSKLINEEREHIKKLARYFHKVSSAVK